ncbi:MAG: NUDIX hydrolase, partial [Rhodospirillales bacterium]
MTIDLAWIGSRFIERSVDTTTKDRGDRDLNPDIEIHSKLKPAAVLIPLIKRPDDITVLFTKRTDTLSVHAGQISFPGGRVEEFDQSYEDAALRETEEEVGLPREQIEILGHLDDYNARTNFKITP